MQVMETHLSSDIKDAGENLIHGVENHSGSDNEEKSLIKVFGYT